MSGIYVTPVESLKLNLCRYYNISGDVTLANPRLAAGLINSEMLIDVVVDKATMTVGYNRFDIGAILGTFRSNAMFFDIAEDTTHLEIVQQINAVLGLQIELSDIDTEGTPIENGYQQIKIRNDHPYLKGSFNIRLSDGSAMPVYPKPLHEFILNGTVENTGTSNAPLTLPVTYVSDIGGMWATIGGGRTPQLFGDGVTFPTNGNWALDFETRMSSYPGYNAMFVDAPVPGIYASGQICFYNGKLYEATRSSGGHGQVMPLNARVRHTLICKDNVIKYYYNGAYVETWNTNSARKAFVGIRNTDLAGQFETDVAFLRNLRFWDYALQDDERDELFKDWGAAYDTTPTYAWDLNGNLEPSAGKVALNDGAFDWIENNNQIWAHHKTNRVAELGVALPVGRDFTFQFKMKLIKQPASMWCGLFGNTGTSQSNDPARIKITSDTWSGTEKPIGYRPYAGLNAPIWMKTPQLDFGIGVESVITVRRFGRTIDMFKNGIKYMTFDADPHSSAITKVGASKEWMTDGVLLREMKYWDRALAEIPTLRPTPLYEWMLDGNTLGTGEDPITYTPSVNFVTMAGMQFATFKNPGVQYFPKPLPTGANWVIDLTMFFKSWSEYEHLMGGPEASNNQTGVIKMWSGAVYEAYCTQSKKPKALGLNAPMRLTFVCRNNTVYYYLNKELQCTWPKSGRPNITTLRTLYNAEGQLPTNSAFFRAFRYYNRALNDDELSILFQAG